jgi:RNA polymerase sigma-70 factor (ECF subfamily)
MNTTVLGTGDDERDLIARCRAREDEAWRELRAAHERRLMRLAYGFFHDAAIAEDITQETFLRALGAMDQFRGQSRVGVWLRRIALNLCLRHRERQRQAEVSMDDPDGQRVVESQSRPVASAEDDCLRREIGRTIHGAIRRLPREYRVPVALADLQGHDYGEIAELTDVPLGTVKSRISRGRARVRQMVAGRV